MNRLLENFDYYNSPEYRLEVQGTPIITAFGRRGSQCLDGSDEGDYGAFRVSTSGNEIIVGAAVSYITAGSGAGKIFGFGDDTASGFENCYISGNDDGSLSAYRSVEAILGISPPGVLNLQGAYNYVEARVLLASGGDGQVEVRVNGDPVLVLNSTDTYRVGSIVPSLVWIYPQGRRRYDDVYINDATGLQNNDFEGDVRIDHHMPDADGDLSQWNRSTGLTQFATIDEIPPDEDNSYNFTSTSGNTDTLSHDPLIPAFAGIKAVSLIHRARKASNGEAAIGGIVRSEAINTELMQHVLTSGYRYYETTAVHESVPAVATDDGFNAAQWGYRKQV